MGQWSSRNPGYSVGAVFRGAVTQVILHPPRGGKVRPRLGGAIFLLVGHFAVSSSRIIYF